MLFTTKPVFIIHVDYRYAVAPSYERYVQFLYVKLELEALDFLFYLYL